MTEKTASVSAIPGQGKVTELSATVGGVPGIKLGIPNLLTVAEVVSRNLVRKVFMSTFGTRPSNVLLCFTRILLNQIFLLEDGVFCPFFNAIKMETVVTILTIPYGVILFDRRDADEA